MSHILNFLFLMATIFIKVDITSSVMVDYTYNPAFATLALRCPELLAGMAVGSPRKLLHFTHI